MTEGSKPVRTATVIMEILRAADGKALTIETLIDELKERGYQPKHPTSAVRSSLMRLAFKGDVDTEYSDWDGTQGYFDRRLRQEQEAKEEERKWEEREQNREREAARKALIPVLAEACREILAKSRTPMSAHEIRDELSRRGIKTTSVNQITGVLNFHLKVLGFKDWYEVRGTYVYRTLYELASVATSQSEG